MPISWTAIFTNLAALGVSAALLAPLTPFGGQTLAPPPLAPCEAMWERIQEAEVGWFFQLDDPEQVEEWWAYCEDLTFPFYGLDDKLHILGIAQCESGLSATANDDRWRHLKGSRPQGMLSMMSGTNWPKRLGLPWLDPYNTRNAAILAHTLVYGEVNAKVSAPNFYWWWSCSHYMHSYYRALDIHAPEQWYCPPKEYWRRVPPSSGLAAKKDCGVG